MGTTSLPVLAGVTSTAIFAASALPMLVKAWRTRDLASYSRGNLVLSNVGNAVHSIYVYSMPVGPIWLLHTFYLISSALMLLWSVRYRGTAVPGLAGVSSPGQGVGHSDRVRPGDPRPGARALCARLICGLARPAHRSWRS